MPHTVQLPDGRMLEVHELGDADGFPVVFHHGTPGSGTLYERWRTPGVRLIGYDRAGYGGSTRRAGRAVADVVADVEALADALGLDRFATWGLSGGGPHALACAARLPDRVVRATCVVGSAPYGPPGLERDGWFAGMDPENVKEFETVFEGEEALVAQSERMQAKYEEQAAAETPNFLEEYELSDSDRAHLARPEVTQILREAIREHAVNGVYGWTDDLVALTGQWGFDVSEITVPVLIRYGAADVLVPRGHGDWLAANVPGCIVKVDDAGHMGRDPVEEIAEDVRWLRDGTPPA